MNRAVLMALSIATVVTSAAAIGIGAANSGASEAIGRQHYVAARAGLDNASADATVRCESLREGPAREICRAEVAAYQVVRAAELEHAYRHNRESARATQRARIEARYQVERAKCSAVGGSRRDACLVKAHAARGQALLEAASPYSDARS